MSPADATVALPRNFLRPCILLLLREAPAHGYDLLERLQPLGFSRPEPGRVYRALRALEAEGLVHSAWAPSPDGPDRRIYELTRAGMEALHESVQLLIATNSILGAFLGRYAEFVALEPARPPVRERG